MKVGMHEIYVAKFPNSGATITYDPQERSINVSIKDRPLLKLLPDGRLGSAFTLVKEKGATSIRWTYSKGTADLEIFYNAIIGDVVNLHTAMSLEAEKDPDDGDYTAVSIETNDLRVIRTRDEKKIGGQ